MTLNIGKSLAASGLSWRNNDNNPAFGDPFVDMASLAMPRTMPDALRWCEFIFYANNVYGQALNRSISYFITEVEITNSDIGREEKQKYLDVLNDTLDITNMAHTVALDFVCYGNAFTSVLLPFRRSLVCGNKRCAAEWAFDKVVSNPVFAFRWTNFTFHAHCPKCGYSGKWTHVDRRSGSEGDLKIKRWSPHDIELLWDPFWDDSRIIWKIPVQERQQIRDGVPRLLGRLNWEVVQAIKNEEHLLFDKDVVTHLKEPTLAGAENRGWGISRMLANLRQAWYVQVLHQRNESLALDYVIPFRVITPAPRAGAADMSGDPVFGMGLGNFRAQVDAMLRARRQDPCRWNVLPFPINYQALGGDASQLAPESLLDQGIDTLLNGAGIPADLYRGNLTTQTAIPTLRVFEANWSGLVHHLNRFVQSVADALSRFFSWEPIKVRLLPASHAADLGQQMAKLQLMMGGQISQTSGLRAVNMDFESETRQKLEEEKITAEQQQRLQEELQGQADMSAMAQQQAAPGAMPGAVPGGAPGAPPAVAAAGMPPGGGMGGLSGQATPDVPITPQELMAKAQMIAEQLMGLPETQKDSALIQLKRSDPSLHAAVKQSLTNIRQQAQSVGQQQVLAQQFGKMGAATAHRWLQRRGRGLEFEAEPE